jgi:hypothetical protein
MVLGRVRTLGLWGVCQNYSENILLSDAVTQDFSDGQKKSEEKKKHKHLLSETVW